MTSLKHRSLAVLLRRYPFNRMRGTILKVLHERAATDGKVWCKSPGGDVLADLADLMGEAVFYFGDQDPALTWVCRRLVSRGNTVLDIGANIGVMTLLLSQLVEDTGIIYSFEPNPPIYSGLAAAIKRNNVKNVRLQSIALGSEPGALELFVPAGNAGAGSLIRKPQVPGGHRVVVKMETLDRFLAQQNISSIHFIKIDVEGFEEQVLQGARHTFESIRPQAVLFEMNDYFGRPLFEHPVFRMLHEFDYQFFGLRKKLLGVSVIPLHRESISRDFATDFIAIPRGELSRTAAAKLGIRHQCSKSD
jgi:FkbM family methyltransferase